MIRVIREQWSIEKLFKKLHSNEIMLPSDKNPLPFIWNEIENEDKLSLSNVTLRGYRCLHYSSYSSNLRTNYGKLSWNEAEREIEEKYGVNTLWDLFKSKFPRLSNIGVQGPMQSGSPGFHIIAPIYTKNLEGKLDKCKDTVNNDIVSSDIYNLLCCHYIKPYDNLIEFFIKSEGPIIFLKLKTVLKHLNKYILELDSKTKIKTEKKIEIAIKDCNNTISELRRDYKLREERGDASLFS